MRQKIPTYTPAKKRKRRLSDQIKFKTKASPKKSKKSKRPSSLMEDEDSTGKAKGKDGRGIAKGLAIAASAMPGGSGIGGIAKAGLAGAAAGAEIEASYREYKASRAASKARKATTTVSQSAMAQKAKYHKKDKTGTKKV